MRLLEKENVSISFDFDEWYKKFFIVNRQRRLTEQDKSLFKHPPDTAESTIIHNLFLKTITPK